MTCVVLILVSGECPTSLPCSLSRHMLVDRLSKGEEVSVPSGAVPQHRFLLSGYLFKVAVFIVCLVVISLVQMGSKRVVEVLQM